MFAMKVFAITLKTITNFKRFKLKRYACLKRYMHNFGI
jgi:hypothetical protein